MLHSIFTSQDYSRGLQYFRAGRVGKLHIDSDDRSTEVSCTVQGSRRYHVSFVMDKRGTITLNCSCPRFRDVYRCKHLVASMLAYIDAQPDEDSPAVRPAPTRAVESDPSARRMLDTYVRRRNAALGMEASAMVVPRLREGETYNLASYPAISLRVGRDRFYVVQNIRTFLENVAGRQTAAYGKNLTLDHSIEGFDAKSRQLIGLLMNEFPEYRDNRERYGSERDYIHDYIPNYNKNELTLNGDAFDRFFDMYLGDTLEADWTDEVELKEGDPKVTLRLEPAEGAVTLSVLLPKSCHLFGSARTLYARDDEAIRRCSEGFRAQVWPLISDGQPNKKLALQDFPTFCSCVLPAIQDYVEVRDEQGLLQKYLPDECAACFYFDIDGDALTLTLKYRYGDREIADNVPAAATAEIKRDVIVEQDAAAFAGRWFTRDGNNYVLRGEDEVFTFLTDSLDAFHAHGEVFVSDRLRNRRVQPSQATVGISVSEGLLTLDLSTGDFPPEELEQLYQSLLRRRKYHKLPDGRYLALDGSSYETLAEMAHMLQLSAKELKKGKLTMPAFRGLYLDELLGGSEDLRVDRDARFRAMVRDFKSVSESDYAVPPELEHTLRPYQKVGFAWLKTLESSRFGGILADEMGLGKTLEVIAFLRTVDRKANEGPSLVVCPASLILNWGDELTRFAPTLTYSLIMGAAAERRAMIANDWDRDVWVTSYELLRSDIEQYSGLRFYCCVLDEAQHIKNQSTLASKAVKSVRCRQRFVLTGTPVENRLSELWNLFDFLMPGYLFSHSAFVEKLEKPIVRSKNDDAMRQLRRLVQPFMLRRLKKDVLKELPAKLEYTRRIPMSESERKTYLAAVNETKRALENGQGKLQVLSALTTLRQICCDPDLCFENYEGETSKLDACVELCSGMVQNGHQILLFSQFTSMLERIQARLDGMGISNFTLRGSTPKQKRAELVRSFNEGGASVFLISLKAGGTGLNLTAADVVIHYDPWWNQAAQDQATDRAHRIGQQAHVQVYKLIMQGSIEERILELQEKKASLMDALSEGNEAGILNMSREELLALLD